MDPRVTELCNDYIHGDMPRRSFLKQLAIITGGAPEDQEAAAKLSWQRTINFFDHYLKA
jgi:hypothetical protein